MKYVFVLLLSMLAFVAHGQSMLAHDAPAFETVPAQSVAMSCCDEATGGHSSAACSVCTTALPQEFIRGLGPFERQTFVISDWTARDIRFGPLKAPPRRL